MYVPCGIQVDQTNDEKHRYEHGLPVSKAGFLWKQEEKWYKK
jgi:hypothetical protein